MKILSQYLNELTTILHYRPALDLDGVLYEKLQRTIVPCQGRFFVQGSYKHCPSGISWDVIYSPQLIPVDSKKKNVRQIIAPKYY